MTTMDQTAAYVAARASESLSYGDIAYAQSQGWCSSSPDGMGSHRPDDTTDPVTCAECGATIEREGMTVQELRDALDAYLARAPEAGSDVVWLVADDGDTPLVEAEFAYRDGPILALTVRA